LSTCALFIIIHLPRQLCRRNSTFADQNWWIQKLKIFCRFLSKITFEPGMPGSWKGGKRAKWIRWDIKRPGVAPCEGNFEIYGRKWQRQLRDFRVSPEKTSFLLQKLIVKIGKKPLCTPENMGNNFVHHSGSAKPTSSWWNIAQNGKKCAKVENGVLRKRQVLSSGSGQANQTSAIQRT